MLAGILSLSPSSSVLENDEYGLRQQGPPWFLVADFDGDRAFTFRRGKNGEKIERLAADIVSAVNNPHRKIKRIAGFHDVLFSFHPLFGLAGKDVENFLHFRVKVELVGLSWWQLRANEHQVGVPDHPRLAMPEMRLAGERLYLCFFEGNESPGWP